MLEPNKSTLLCTLIVVLFGCHRRSDPNSVRGVSVAAFDGGAVIATAKASSHEFGLERHNEDGSQTWQHPLDCEAAPALIASPAAVVASCSVNNETTLAAYSLQDGHEIWRYRSKYVSGGSMQPRMVDGAVVVTGENGILVLDQATGKLRLEYPTKIPVRGASIEGSRLAYRLPPLVVIVDAASGKQDSVEREGFGCMGHDTLWSKENGQLVASKASDLSSATRHIEMNGTVSGIIACGVYAGDAVVELTIDSNNETANHVVRLSAQDTVVWDLKLGDENGPESRLSSEWRDASGLNGDLTRYSLALTHDQKGTRVVVVDLQTGTMQPTPRALSDHETVTMTAMRAGGSWYVANGDDLTVYDGASGVSVGAGVFDAGAFVRVTPASVSSRGLWLLSDGWSDGSRELFVSPALKKISGNMELRAARSKSN